MLPHDQTIMKLIVLDRDGVINRDSEAYIKSPDEWQPLSGSLEAIAQLHRAGWKIVVATNQSGIARKLLDEKTLAAIHAKMHCEVQKAGGWIDDIVYCPHGPEDDCACRKPRPGLFHQIAHKWHIDLHGVPCVGDSLRDLQAARQLGCEPILVLTGNGATTRTAVDLPIETLVFPDLSDAARHLLAS